MNISRSVLFLALASIGSAAHAGEAESAIPEPSVFVQQAMQSGLVEIEAARIALARSQDPGIRSFAQRMMRDHGKSNSELAKLAAAQGIEAPTKLDARHQATLDKVTSKTGVDFDRSYSQHMYMGHIRGVALYEAAVNSPDAAISAFAHKMLPTLRDHKQLAEQLSGGTLEGGVPGGR